MAYTAETGFVGFAVQNVQGVFEEPSDFMKVQSIELNPEGDKLIPDPEIGSGNDITDVHQGSYKISGDIDSYVRPEAMGILIYGLLGGYVASGEINGGQGNYLHNFRPVASGSLPFISIKKSIAENIQVFDYVDCKIESMNLELNAGEFATVTFGVVGISDKLGAPVSPTYETAPLLVATKARLVLGGAEISAKNLVFNYNNNFDSDDFRIGSRFLGDITEKRRELEVTLDVVLDTTSKLYQKAFYGGAALTEAAFDVYSDSLDIIMESPVSIGSSTTKYKWLISINRAVFMAAPTPASGDDLVVIPLTLKPIKNGQVNILEMKLWNGKASYSL